VVQERTDGAIDKGKIALGGCCTRGDAVTGAIETSATAASRIINFLTTYHFMCLEQTDSS
jgi:hypothetical protein